MIRRPPRSTPLYSSAASDVYKRQDLCVAEEEFKGTVKVVVKKPFSVKAILIEINGMEVTRIADQRALNNIIVDYIPLELPNRQGVVYIGTYTLPFHFKLPGVFPCSVPEFSIEGIRAFIEYRCIAKLEMNNTDPIESVFKLNFAQPPRLTEPVALHQVKTVKGWFNMTKGIAELEAVIPKTEIFSGEQLSLNINLNCENCLLKVKRIKCKLYEETIVTDERGKFTGRPKTRIKVMKRYLPGVEARHKVSYVETVDIPVKYESRILESINGQYIKRYYVLMLVPAFDIIRGDKMMSVETVMAISSLSVDAFSSLKHAPYIFHSQLSMPAQSQVMEAPAQMSFVPQAANCVQPIPPEIMREPFPVEPILPQSSIVRQDGVPLSNPPLYPSLDLFEVPPLQDRQNAKSLYPQLQYNYPLT
eukprot:TRINITY_DN1045_c0_g2_i1.p1 TRINITY_DN1045_c0_g2~~TRINITY_DN1045_c0_g2_i1.p1  ORF type:complete len:425 (+),score=82.39 TRINITY_DN1045_c0_g2_i1:23-1276(+)